MLQDAVLRRKEPPLHSLHHPVEWEISTILGGRLLQGRTETCVECFQVGEPIPQSNVGQVIVGASKVIEGVLDSWKLIPTICLKSVEM